MQNTIPGLIDTYGYALLFLLVGLESIGIPLPGETALVTAAAVAGSGRMSIEGVILTAALAAILGDNGGYWLGRKGGLPLVRRFGQLLHVDESTLDRAHRFFERHGAKTVFIGRFVALLRTWAAVLAGMSDMQYRTFMLYNATGGITWAVIFGTLGYLFGRKVPQLEQYLGQATLAVVLLATVFVALVLGGRWFLEHADRLAERVSRAVDQIARARLFRSFPDRHPRAWRFVLRRFAAGEYLGLHLTVGLIVSLAAVWVFGGVTEDVIHHDPLTHFDVTLLEWLHQHRTPFAFTMFAAITRLGSPVLIAGVAIVVDVVLAIRERWLQFLSWNAALGGAAVLSMVLKRVIQRPRPVYAAALHEYSYSFPSGHALGSLIGYGMLAYLLVVFWAKRPDTQVAIVAAATLLIAAIGLSRLYLGVHYFSDIIAGYAAGMVWLSTCITALEVARRQPANASPI